MLMQQRLARSGRAGGGAAAAPATAAAGSSGGGGAATAAAAAGRRLSCAAAVQQAMPVLSAASSLMLQQQQQKQQQPLLPPLAAASPQQLQALQRRRLTTTTHAASAAAAAATEAAAPPAAAGGPPPPPPTPTASLVALLRARGLLQDVTSDELERVLTAQRLPIYCGFDPTADSLHLGNLLGIIVLAWAGACGHRPVALLGGATGRVGDPSGRSTERPVLSEDEIGRNAEAIGDTLRTILTRAAERLRVGPDGAVAYAADAAASPTSSSSSSPGSSSSSSSSSNGGGDGGAPLAGSSSSSSSGCGGEVTVLNNLDWFGPMSFLGFLRDVGKHARVGAMLSKDSVRSRMESEAGISFTEFAYQLLQGYDFVHLAKEHGVRVQAGGSDQWGNITAGTDLVRKLLGGPDAEPPACYGLTFPLLVDSDGKKVGKSTGGAVWLSAARLSPYKFYQHLFATGDADVGRFLRMLTFLPLDEISQLEAAMRDDPSYVPNTAQRRLAECVTRFVHGDEGLAQALKATEALRPGAETALDDAAALEAIAGDAPSTSLPASGLVGAPLVDVMVAAGLGKSKGEVRRLLRGGGVYVNNAKVADEARVLQAGDLIEGRLLLLAAGKKNKMLVRVEG